MNTKNFIKIELNETKRENKKKDIRLLSVQ